MEISLPELSRRDLARKSYTSDALLYTPFRSRFPHHPFRILLSAFHNSAFYRDPTLLRIESVPAPEEEENTIVTWSDRRYDPPYHFYATLWSPYDYLYIMSVLSKHTHLVFPILVLSVLQTCQRMASPVEKLDISILQRRPHTRSCAPVWSLPAELILHLFRGLQIKDLLNLRSVKSTICQDIWRSYHHYWFHLLLA